MRDQLYFCDHHGKFEVVSQAKAAQIIDAMRDGKFKGCTLTDEYGHFKVEKELLKSRAQ